MSRCTPALVGLVALCGAVRPLASQATPSPTTAIVRVDVQPPSLTLDVGETGRLTATAFDSSGKPVTIPLAFFSSARRDVGVDSTGLVTAYRAGDFTIHVVALGATGAPMRGQAAVHIRWPGIKGVGIEGSPTHFYAGTTIRLHARITDATAAVRTDVPVTWSSSDPARAQVETDGSVSALGIGPVTISARAGSVSSTVPLRIVPNPVRTLRVVASALTGRTGDVIHFSAVARDAAGRVVADLPTEFSLRSSVEDTVIAPEAPADVDQQGRFVAQRAGNYTVYATAGNLVGRQTVSIGHRWTSMRLEMAKGQGAVRDVRTSDLWVWPGADGRDYALTGTWSGAGKAYFWDVTDPAHIVKTDSIQVDARTTNDVKVDATRGLCFVTREGASNRKNGLVIVDCSDPHHVKILSNFDDGLWGGVHNVFYWNKRVFAVNNGTRFDVINVENPLKPYREGVYELDTPGHGIHDIWIVDGIAYTSNWADGVVLIDVGNGKYGGSPAHPVKFGQYKYPIGATHSAFPYRSKGANKFYVFVGDEQFPYELPLTGPDEAGGYIHVIDFSDVTKPEEVARYQIPEAGPHNFWVQNDSLYIAYYNAGLRVVDVSGELKGNLYDQGRELVRFHAFDPQGVVANAPMSWGPQPYKGYVFVSEHHSGLWAVKLPKREGLTP